MAGWGDMKGRRRGGMRMGRAKECWGWREGGGVEWGMKRAPVGGGRDGWMDGGRDESGKPAIISPLSSETTGLYDPSPLSLKSVSNVKCIQCNVLQAILGIE